MMNRLIVLYQKTFDYAVKDPEVSLVWARKYAEAFCLDSLQITGGRSGHRPRSLEDLIKQVQGQNAVPPELHPPLRTIQSYGNAGSHEHEGGPLAINEAYVQPCLHAVATLHARFLARRAELHLDAQVQAPEAASEVRIATSRLTVVRAIEVAWGMEKLLAANGFTPSILSYPWSNRILEDLTNGRLDVGIYNHVRSQKYLEDNANGPRIAGSFGHSMGGRNFYLLARAGGRWRDLRGSDPVWLDELKDVTIAVPYGSDIIENIHLALGMEDRELKSRGIQLFNIPANSGLEVFQMDPDMLVSAGQNIRMLARLEGGFREVLTFDHLPGPVQAEFVRRAENVLLISRDAMARFEGCDLKDIFAILRRNFALSWLDDIQRPNLVRLLASVIELDGITIDEAEAITRSILYETYRIGHP